MITTICHDRCVATAHDDQRGHGMSFFLIFLNANYLFRLETTSFFLFQFFILFFITYFITYYVDK